MAQVKVARLLAADEEARTAFKMTGITTVHAGANWVGVAGFSGDETYPGHGLWVSLQEYRGNELLGETLWVRPYKGITGPITQLVQLPYTLRYQDLVLRGFYGPQ
jgi:hypothetical protein